MSKQPGAKPADPEPWANAFASGSLMKVYEDLLPRLFMPWAELLTTRLAIASRERVLDVATGTGAVARLAAVMAGPSGTITAIDNSRLMLKTARAKPPIADAAPIEYLECAAEALTVDDESFDVVTCLQGLPFFTDRPSAASEMLRALRPGGRAGVVVWQTIDNIPTFDACARALREVAGDELANRYVAGPWSFGDLGSLRALLADAGFVDVTVTAESLPLVLLGGPGELFATIAVTPVGAGLAEMSVDDLTRMIEIITDLLSDEIVDGVIRSHVSANVAIARKP